MNPTAHPCPQCGGTQVKLVLSRDVYPDDLPPDASSPSIAIAYTYECHCGNVYVVTVKHDSGGTQQSAKK